jgi:hypothetical protein
MAIHVSGEQMKYVATIKDIVAFSRTHHADREFANKVKPSEWIKEWEQNVDEIRNRPWKNALVITDINPFLYDTLAFKQYRNGPVTRAPQGYIRVIPPK